MLDFVFEIFFQIIAYGTGRLLIPILTLGTMRGEGFKGEAPAGNSSLWRDEKGIVLSAGLTSLIGVLLWIAVAVTAVIYFNH